jgi:hypothetical protein
MEHVYVVRDASKCHMGTLKIGRTLCNLDRMHGYPKGSEVLLMVRCHGSAIVERRILETLRRITTPIKSYGNEYFQGSEEVIMSVVWRYARDSTTELRKFSQLEDIGITCILEFGPTAHVKRYGEWHVTRNLREFLYKTFVASHPDVRVRGINIELCLACPAYRRLRERTYLDKDTWFPAETGHYRKLPG